MGETDAAATARREALVRAQLETMSRAGRVALVLVVAALVAALDQWTKLLVLNNVPLGRKCVVVIDGVLWLSHVYNQGIAWGMLDGQPTLVSAIAVCTAAGVLLVALFGRFGWRTYVVGLGMVVGGAAGNLIDRWSRTDGVLDFIDLGWWPQFNIADAAVVCGAGLIAYAVIGASRLEDRAMRGIEVRQGALLDEEDAPTASRPD